MTRWVAQFTWSTFLLAAGTALVTASAVAADPLITSTPSPAIRLTPPARSFSLVATGDVLTESLVTSAAAADATRPGERFDFAPLFAPVAAIVSSADLAICHMEMPVGAPGERPGVYGSSPFGGNLILAPYEIADGLRRTGFDRCSTASNHSNDLGEPGIATTLAALDDAGITHAGTARLPSESTPAILTVNGIRVAHLAYTRYSNTVLPAEPWRVNFAASPSQVAADVAAVRAAGAEVVVVSLHLSKELQPSPDPVDRQFVTIRCHHAVGDNEIARLQLRSQRTGEPCRDDPLGRVCIEQRLSRPCRPRLPWSRLHDGDADAVVESAAKFEVPSRVLLHVLATTEKRGQLQRERTNQTDIGSHGIDGRDIGLSHWAFSRRAA